MPQKIKTAEQRLSEFVLVTGFCWLWTGELQDGYGYVKAHKTPRTTAHRYVYEYLVGPVPEGLQLDHLCRIRNCVNPDHLEPVTIAENVRRGQSFSARNKRKTHCNQGHEFTDANTIKVPNGRACKQCRELKIRKWRREKAEAEGREYKPRSRTHCPKGHEFTEENTYNYGQGRRCRACNKARQQLGKLQADQAQLDASFNPIDLGEAA